jgi:ankyrin repeat protein
VSARASTVHASRAVIAAALLAATSCGAPSPSAYTVEQARAYVAARGFEAAPEELLRAVDGDALDVVAALLALGVDPDALGGRALSSAAREGRIEMLELLLDGGADPNLGRADRQNAVAAAVIHHQREAVEVLLERGADLRSAQRPGESPLLYAVDVGIAERLLDGGADVDARDARGGTALMGAVMVGDRAMVDLLLARGADPDATDSAGRTALLYATVLRFSEIQERLLGAGADRLPSPEVAMHEHGSYVGRYGDASGSILQIVAEPGRLLLIERDAKGLLFANELRPLSPTRFYRANDPGAVIYEMRVEDGRVTSLAHTAISGWASFARLADDPA